MFLIGCLLPSCQACRAYQEINIRSEYSLLESDRPLRPAAPLHLKDFYSESLHVHLPLMHLGSFRVWQSLSKSVLITKV